ncbi:MAG: hypothetical protein KAR20_28410, partial [Candidatus Heimdallarchaeota archaeon]|nr:hypothetical protein [Candidatus Heimdallarchaeota archaeon]
MSCSARLPVYTLIISALIPQQAIWGFIQLQGLILLGVYFLGFLTALFIAFVVKLFTKKTKRSHYIIELPPYRMPMLQSLWWRIFDAGKKFIITAGSIILALAISYDCLYEHICLYSLTYCFSGRKTDRTGIIMEELALTLILILAALYVFRHVKR